MTQYLFDIASYQAGIDLVKVKQAGFTIANVKTSQGTGYTFKSAGDYCRQAAALGMGVSVFHWLDNSGTGAAQADACWRVLAPIARDLGGRVALQIDCEDSAKPAPWNTLRDFHNAMADHLGHRPYVYTGDWWATAGGRSAWNVASLTPWLMAAPNAGYLPKYPGDTSPHWLAGYWGYGDLALMQYNVGPITGAGGGDISKTAIRDTAVWPALIGGSQLVVDDYGNYGKPKVLGDRTVPVEIADLWWNEMNGDSPYAPGAKGYRGKLLDRLDVGVVKLLAAADADVVRDTALQAAFDAIARSSGGNLDAAPIVAAVRDSWSAAQQRFDQLHSEIAAGQAREARLVAVLAALGADLSALGVEPPAQE